MSDLTVGTAAGFNREVRLPRLHPMQAEIARDTHRFRLGACGRRWGKTRLGVVEALASALQGRRVWWVAPTYMMASIAWRQMRQLGAQLGATVREVDRLITLPGAGEVWFKSSDNPDNLRGEGLDLLVLDECAFVVERAWHEVLRPALADRKGRGLFFSTPKGRNWFWRMWVAGQSGDDAEIRSWQLPTSSNPFIAADEIEAARRSLPERTFGQEFLAEFVDDAGAVFRRITDATTAEPQDHAVEGHRYALGLDWGRTEDFTVAAVLDLTDRALVALDRFNQIDYSLQVGRIKALCERFNPSRVIAERNSMGDPLVEQLTREGLRVEPFLTTNATKAAAIEALALAFERGEIRVIANQVLQSELLAYTYDRLPSGVLRYSAPEGMHDDCVMALALAWQAVAGPHAFLRLRSLA